jgi:hypothetical protein
MHEGLTIAKAHVSLAALLMMMWAKRGKSDMGGSAASA